MRGIQMLRKALEDRERLSRQIENLQHQLVGMDRAIANMRGETVQENAPLRKERMRNMKGVVLGILAEANAGMSVGEVLSEALRKGIHLERNSVSSLLSRLKREDVLSLDDGGYSVRVRHRLRTRPVLGVVN